MKTRIQKLSPFGRWVLKECNRLGIHQKEIAWQVYTGKSKDPLSQEKDYRRVLRGDRVLCWYRHIIPTIEAIAHLEGEGSATKISLLKELTAHLTQDWRKQ